MPEVSEAARKAAEEIYQIHRCCNGKHRIDPDFPCEGCYFDACEIDRIAAIIERHMQPIVQDMIDSYTEQDNSERIFYATVEMRALDAERDAMNVANERRREQGYSLAYDENAFFEIAERYRHVKGVTPCPI